MDKPYLQGLCLSEAVYLILSAVDANVTWLIGLVVEDDTFGTIHICALFMFSEAPHSREIAILAGKVMDTLNTEGATYLKNGPKPKTTTQKNNDHDKPPYYPPPTALFLGIYTPAASDRWHDG